MPLPSVLVVRNMKPGSQQVLFNFPGRLNCKHWAKPVHVVICTLVAIKNVGVPCMEFSFHPTHSVLLNLKLQTQETLDVLSSLKTAQSLLILLKFSGNKYLVYSYEIVY